MTPADCIFCKIVLSELPAEKIFENDHVIALLDIHPVNPGHTLIISKEHFPHLYDLSDEALCELFITARNLSVAIKKAVGATGVNIEMNNEPDAGQIVNHAHVHIIPRFHDDGYRHWPGKDTTPQELAGTGNKIRALL